jgi:hypothetical protein
LDQQRGQTLPPQPLSFSSSSSSSLPIIAICACTTTRNLNIESIEDLALFKTLLPSIRDTAESGYEYWVYLGYDIGDEFFDHTIIIDNMISWYQENMIKGLRDRKIHTRFFVERFENPEPKPGPAFNYLTHLAYIDGATYIYRVNDDTKFIDEWSSEFINKLQSWGEPYGAVGPRCDQGNTMILTHDFTHRLHHEIFPLHYPSTLNDWWMDDWISRVYGRRRTARLHHVAVERK